MFQLALTGGGNGIGRDNQQLFTNEAPLGAVAEILDNGGAGFDNRPFNVVDFQRPNGVRGSFSPAFQLAGLVEIANVGKGGELYSLSPTGLQYFVEGLAETAFSLMATADFLPVRLVT